MVDSKEDMRLYASQLYALIVSQKDQNQQVEVLEQLNKDSTSKV